LDYEIFGQSGFDVTEISRRKMQPQPLYLWEWLGEAAVDGRTTAVCGVELEITGQCDLSWIRQ
jgi:hypothetical protein